MAERGKLEPIARPSLARSSGGPVARAAAALAPALDELDPAAFLAALIDLPGGVSLTEELAALESVRASGAMVCRQALRAQVQEELAAIDSRLNDACDNAFKPRYRLPGPERALRLLSDADALKMRKGAPLKTASRNLYAAYGEFLDTQTKRARFALRDLREAITPQLAALSDEAARLERLDAALTRCTHGPVERLIRRISYAFEQRFDEALKATVLALPPSPTVEALEPAFGERGWIRDEFGRALALIKALVAQERLRVESLVERCLESA